MRKFTLKVDDDGVIRFALGSPVKAGETIEVVEQKPRAAQITEEEFEEIWLTTPIRADTLFADLKKRIFAENTP